MQEQLDRDRERELRAHAETISVWTEHDTARDAVVLKVHNSSQIAAHDLRDATGRLRRFESDCGHAKEWKKGSGRPLCTCGDGARTPAE